MSELDTLHVLERLGIDQDHLRSLVLLPLVEIAWADGEIQPGERSFLTKLAQDEDEEMLLESWLSHPPSPACLHHARAALHHFARKPHPALPAELIADVPRLARKVASAAGGWFRIGAVCPEEQIALQVLQESLGDAPSAAPRPHPDFERRIPPATPAEEFSARETHALLIPERAHYLRERLQPAGTVVGSGPEAHHRVAGDDRIAPGHAVLARPADRWLVSAQEGPVWVNGERVQRRRLLGGELVRLSPRAAFWFRLVRPVLPPKPRTLERVGYTLKH